LKITRRQLSSIISESINENTGNNISFHNAKFLASRLHRGAFLNRVLTVEEENELIEMLMNDSISSVVAYIGDLESSPDQEYEEYSFEEEEPYEDIDFKSYFKYHGKAPTSEELEAYKKRINRKTPGMGYQF
jgi:hypothetical protein